MIRPATKEDLVRICEIYKSIHDAEEAGLTTTGWMRGIYPTSDTAENAIGRGDLFVLETDGVICAAAIINHKQDKEYADCDWQYPADDAEVMVLHTLVVDPKMKGRGFGSVFVKFYEEYSREKGCKYLRMDTNSRNTKARRLYAKLGYEERGALHMDFNGIPNVVLICLEKKL